MIQAEPNLSPLPKIKLPQSEKVAGTDTFTILLVDDLRENMLYLEKLLESKDRTFLQASNGLDALELIDKHPEIGLILLDVQMPGMNGFEVAKVFNSNPVTCAIPFLFVTSNQIEDKNILEGFEKGAVDYLIKPLNPTITRAKVAVFEKLYFQQQQLKKTIIERDRVNVQLERYTKVMAHDLKTPLAGIISLISLIKINERVQDIDDVLEELVLLETLSFNLSDMITSVLQDSRKVHEESEQRVAVEDIVNKSITLLQPPASINITIDDALPVLMAREIILQQVFQNLIGNAIKYNDKPEGEINIGCSFASNFYKFYVKDNGPGIKSEDLIRIFEKFATGDTPSQIDSSTGLGLHFIKTSIEEQGGKIWAESSLGEGSVFYFLWPAANCKD